MPGPSTIPKGNVLGNWVLAVTLSPASVAANTTVEQTFTVTGLNVGDFVDVAKPTVQAGLSLINARISAANTLAVGFGNATGSPIVPTASEVYQVCVTRPENLTGTGVSILTQLV